MTTLDLQHNQMKQMIDLDHMRSYEILILNKNYLRYVPFDKIPSSVKHLSLDQNKLKRLEIDVPMPNLQTLSVELNDIKYVDIVVYLNALHTLNLRKNNISNLDFLDCTPHLRYLDISFNDFKTLSNLPSTLETLKASFSEISMTTSRMPPSLLELTLVGNSLKNGGLPLFWGTGLRSLNLAMNHLTEFPKRLPDSLEHLQLQSNQITEIPSRLPSNLKVLNLALNKIRKLPAKTNVRLEMLVLSGNQITQDVTKEPLQWSRYTLTEWNWDTEDHHKAQKTIKKCWKRYLLKIRCRHIYRAQKIYDELMMIALHPDRILQTDVFSPEWFRASPKP
jgi:Leucine-rich repeat (LRR) protein